MARAGQVTEAQKMWLLRTYGNKCQYCGIDLVTRKAHVDHILPVAQGGRTILENLTITCERCNIEKGARTAEEYIHAKELSELRAKEWYDRQGEIEQRIGLLPDKQQGTYLPEGGMGSSRA